MNKVSLMFLTLLSSVHLSAHSIETLSKKDWIEATNGFVPEVCKLGLYNDLSIMTKENCVDLTQEAWDDCFNRNEDLIPNRTSGSI